MDFVKNVSNNVCNAAFSVYTEILYGVKYHGNIPKYNGKYGTFPSVTEEVTTALMIMLHGMNSSSGQFAMHIEKVKEHNQNHNNDTKMFIPEINNKGMNNLDKCGDEIYQKIANQLDYMVGRAFIYLSSESPMEVESVCICMRRSWPSTIMASYFCPQQDLL